MKRVWLGFKDRKAKLQWIRKNIPLDRCSSSITLLEGVSVTVYVDLTDEEDLIYKLMFSDSYHDSLS